MAKAVKTTDTPIEEVPSVEVTPEVQTPLIDGSNTVDNEIQTSPKVVADLKKEENVAVAASDEETFLRRLLQLQDEGGWGHHLDDLIYERLKQIKK